MYECTNASETENHDNNQTQVHTKTLRLRWRSDANDSKRLLLPPRYTSQNKHDRLYSVENLTVKEICTFASNKDFTHLVILSEKNKVCNGYASSIDYIYQVFCRILIINLPVGPTAYFKVSNFQAGSKIPGHGKPTSHIPELIFNNFSTRLGRRVGRFMGSLFPHVCS